MAAFESPLFEVPMLEGGSDYPTPDATADTKQINDQWKYAEQFWGILECTSGSLPSSPKVQQLVYETDTGRIRYWDGSDWVTTTQLATPDVGTTSARDAKYPTPGSAGARVALAAQAIQWFNTEKGYTEQYFSQYDDAGANLSLSKKTHGWKPTYGKHPLTQFTLIGANQRKIGNLIELTANNAQFEADGVFTDAFDEYEIVLEVGASSGTVFINFQFRTAAAVVAGTNYQLQRLRGGGASASASTQANDPQWQIGHTLAASGTYVTLRVTNPMLAEKKRVQAISYEDADLYVSGGICDSTALCDGLKIAVASGTFTQPSSLQVYGISNGR